MAESELCRTCRRALPDDAPWGLCPACLLGQVMEGETEGPPPTDEARPADFPEFVGRYRLEREIGRGGMGQVLLGHDVEIGREIALKVLLEKYRDSAKMTLRFVEEAKIGGQLVHPAIVPVYERGTFPDGRPFFVMKRVEGRTLADLLNSRSDPTEDLPRYLSIFDQVCQAMAYAHLRKVIHRDLKSPNVMVGAFGEVQTMDWGMAKLLSLEDQPAGDRAIRTIRDGSIATVDGSVKGTPNYMSPEQARGEGDRLDERTDVFSLGAILCEILTGRPPYLGESSEEILAKAAKAELADAMAELGKCGADVELQALARHCLATDQDDRPGNAGEVAAAMASYFEGVRDRLRQAELDRVEAETRAEEESKRRVLADKLADEAEGRANSERKRRRLQVGLAAAVLALTTMGGLGAALYQGQKSARAASIAKVIGVASTMLEVAKATPENIARWRTALAAVQQAEGLAGGDPAALRQVTKLRDEAQAGVDAAERDKTLLDRIFEIRSARSDDPEGILTDAAYAEAFREAGLDLSTLPPAVAGSKIKARPPRVALAVAAALDDWSTVRGRARKDLAFAGRLTEVARAADPDVWRDSLRATLVLQDGPRRQDAIKALVETAKFRELGPTSLILLGQNIEDLAIAETFLRRAQRSHPDDVWVNYDLARVLERRHRREDAARFYTAARALRPETAHDLAHLLVGMGESDEGIAVFQELARLRPENSRHLTCLASALKDHGRSKEAVAVLDRVAAVCREKILLRPGSGFLQFDLGTALQAQGRLDEAIAAYREAIRHMPDNVIARSNLGNVLRSQRKPAESLAYFQEAIDLRPDYADAYSNLGAALINLQRFDEAVTALSKASRLKPDNAIVHYNLGTALKGRRNLDQAIDEFRKAILLKPDLGPAHGNLGATLAEQGKIDEAIAVFRDAILINPELALNYANLGELLRTRGDYAGSLANYKKAHELGIKQPGWRYPSAQWVAEAERFVALVENLPRLLKGEDHPKDAADCLALAQICVEKKRYAFATRSLLEALKADPNLVDDREAQHRFNGARAAVLGAAGLGKDDPPPDEAAKVKLRGQALGWLKAELETWTKFLPQARPAVAQTLSGWRNDTDLATIRDPEALAMLPEVERKEWQSLWRDVDALLKRAQEKSP